MVVFRVDAGFGDAGEVGDHAAAELLVRRWRQGGCRRPAGVGGGAGARGGVGGGVGGAVGTGGRGFGDLAGEGAEVGEFAGGCAIHAYETLVGRVC